MRFNFPKVDFQVIAFYPNTPTSFSYVDINSIHIFPKAQVAENKNAHIPQGIVSLGVFAKKGEKSTQFPIPFSGTVFDTLSHGAIHFVWSVSFTNLEMEVF